MKIVLQSLLFCFLSISSIRAAGGTLPSEFYVKQRTHTLLSTFDIETKQFKLGNVQRKFFSWTLEYDFYDFNDVIQAKAKKRFLSWNTCFDVTDANEQPIGMIEAKPYYFFPSFQIVSPVGELLADGVMNFWRTRYTITSPLYETPIATLSRPFFHPSDKVDWTVSIHIPEAFDQGKIDPRLFVVVMAFQTDKESWQRLEDSRQPRVVQTDATKADTNLKAMNRKLGAYRRELAAIKPAESDFTFVEELTHSITDCATEANFAKRNRLLMKLFTSETLTLEQKKALYIMMKSRLKQ